MTPPSAPPSTETPRDLRNGRCACEWSGDKLKVVCIAHLQAVREFDALGPMSVKLDWNHCPDCGAELDTGYECNGCHADWLPAVELLRQRGEGGVPDMSTFDKERLPLQRYAFGHDGRIYTNEHGNWIRYDEHVEIVRAVSAPTAAPSTDAGEAGNLASGAGEAPWHHLYPEQPETANDADLDELITWLRARMHGQMTEPVKRYAMHGAILKRLIALRMSPAQPPAPAAGNAGLQPETERLAREALARPPLSPEQAAAASADFIMNCPLGNSLENAFWSSVTEVCSHCDGECGTAATYRGQACMPLNGKVRGIDWCIHQIVAALNAGGVETVASCCGHGKKDGSILLVDGRELVIHAAALRSAAEEGAGK